MSNKELVTSILSMLIYGAILIGVPIAALTILLGD